MKINSLLLILTLVNTYIFGQHYCLSESDLNPMIISNTESIVSSKKLRIYTHQVTCKGCPEPYTQAEIFANIEKLNQTFINENISFVWDGCVNIIEDTQFDSGLIPSGTFFLTHYINKTNTYAIENGINIFYFRDDYVFPLLSSGGGLSLSIGGEASSSVSILLAGSNPYPGSNSRVIDLNVISHEVGHMLGLYHTHERLNADQETVARTGVNSNCNTHGDLLCGTAADPNINFNVDANCDWTGSGQDIYGVSFVPDPNNIMAYTTDECLMHFTDDQSERMHRIIIDDPDLSKCLFTESNQEENCSCIISDDILISGQIDFNEPLSFNGSITIDNGALLTITSNLKFGPQGSIYVKQEGKLKIENSILSSCIESAKWQGIIVEGNPYFPQVSGNTGEVEMDNATILNAKIGIRAHIRKGREIYGGAIVKAYNSNFVDCEVGVEFGTYGGFGTFPGGDLSELIGCTFDNAYYGVKAYRNNGVEINDCTFTNIGTAIDATTSTMNIIGNTFESTTHFGLYSHHNWPQVSGSSILDNTFATGYTDILLSGAGNIVGMEIKNNSFFATTAINNYGLTSAEVINNDFFGNAEGLYIEHIGGSSLYNADLNDYSSNNYATSTLGKNSFLTYSGNCFEGISFHNIEVNDDSAISIDQGEGGGTEAGNCFDRTVPTMITGQNTELFTYHIKDDTPLSACKHPGSPGSNNWVIEDDAIENEQRICGSNFTSGIPPTLYHCIIPSNPEQQVAFIDSLLMQIATIEADSLYSVYHKKWLIQRLRKCLRKAEGRFVMERLSEADTSTALTYLQSSTDFELHILAYGLLMDGSKYGDAAAYISTITTDMGAEADFVTSQLIYLNHLVSGVDVSASDLQTIYTHATARNPYSCFARSIYYELTGSRIDLPLIHLSSNAPKVVSDNGAIQAPFSVYPNPVENGEVYIVPTEPLDVLVMDLAGRVVYQANYIKEKVSVLLSDHTGKVLIVRATDVDGVVTFKRIIRI